MAWIESMYECESHFRLVNEVSLASSQRRCIELYLGWAVALCPKVLCSVKNMSTERIDMQFHVATIRRLGMMPRSQHN